MQSGQLDDFVGTVPTSIGRDELLVYGRGGRYAVRMYDRNADKPLGLPKHPLKELGAKDVAARVGNVSVGNPAASIGNAWPGERHQPI